MPAIRRLRYIILPALLLGIGVGIGIGAGQQEPPEYQSSLTSTTNVHHNDADHNLDLNYDDEAEICHMVTA